VGPFQPKNEVADWLSVLGHWVRGTALSEFANNDIVAFIQEDVVYRLVWGVEAARLHLKYTGDIESEIPGSDLALLLTYGVPCKEAAVLMQAGLPSRTV